MEIKNAFEKEKDARQYDSSLEGKTVEGEISRINKEWLRVNYAKGQTQKIEEEQRKVISRQLLWKRYGMFCGLVTALVAYGIATFYITQFAQDKITSYIFLF